MLGVLYLMKTRTWLDYTVWGVAALTVVLAAYLGYSVWAQNTYNLATSPAARAVVNLEKLVKKAPNDPGSRIRLAEAYAAVGNLDQAVNQYNQALKLDAENPFALVGLGQVAMKRKQWSAAEAYWQRTITKLKGGQFAGKDANLELAYYYLGSCLMEEHRYEDAISYLKEAARIRADASDTHYLLAVAYKETGSDDRMRAELNIALAFDPLMPEANYDVGQLLLKQGKVADAAEHFRLSADNAPDVEKPRAALSALGPAEERVRAARSLMAAGNIASATVEARVAVAVDPQDVQALRLLAQLYERENQKKLALDTYAKLAKLLPEDKDVAAAVARLGKDSK